jgi:hypothetical protein
MQQRARVTLTRDDRLIVHAVGDPLDLWDQIRRAYMARRPALVGRDGWRYPATTYFDVVEVANALETVLASIAHDEPSDAEHAGHWRHAYAQIFEALNHHNLTELFGENELFWLHFSLQLSLYLSVRADRARRALSPIFGKTFAGQPFQPER